jgi:ribosomal protein S18 acetylase RimI-like enzyme
MLTLAFAADPVMRWLWPDPHRYATSWPRFAEAFGGGAFGQGTAHGLDDGRAVALWLPPGAAPDDASLGAVILETVDGEMLGEVGEVSEQMAEYHPSSEYWYLTIAGVDPSAQGRGLGSALMAHAVAICDREQHAAYLEASTPRSRRLYERFGFEVVGLIQAGSSPPMWPMVRVPRRSGLS